MEHQDFVRPWANLPSELLSLVASKRSTDAALYVSLRRVCRGWRCSLTDDSPVPPLPSPQLPFLLIPPQNFPNPSVGKVLPITLLNHVTSPKLIDNLPQLRNTENSQRICVGTSHGWLITLNQFSSVSLLNPVTADTIPLQPLSSIDREVLSFDHHYSQQYHLSGKGISFCHLCIVRLAVLSSDPAEDPDFTLLLFLSGLADCCFTCRGSKHTWILHKYPPFLSQVEDVVFLNGVFVAFARPFDLKIFDFKNSKAKIIRQLRFQLREPVGKLYLVNSDGHLLMVYTHCTMPPEVPAYRFIQVLLYFDNLNVDGGYIKPMMLRKPTDVVLFLGHGCSMAVPEQHFPWLTGSMYYFTRPEPVIEEMERGEIRLGWYQGAVYQKIINIYEETHMSEIIKVFDLEKLEHFDSCTPLRLFWVTPNIRRIRR